MLPSKAVFLFPLVLITLLGCTGERAVDVDRTTAPRGEASTQAATPLAGALMGRLVLPGDGGRRGLEVHAWVAGADGVPQQLWIFPDKDGRFARNFSGTLTRVSVCAGTEVVRIEASDLPPIDALGRFDLGEMDLRDRLAVRRVRLRAAEGAQGGVVRVGAWIGAPHTGPFGELPSLGSAQFPPVDLESEMEWLLPPDAHAVHFLVERPDGPRRGTSWRSGKQQLFGPYEPSAFPLDLAVQ